MEKKCGGAGRGGGGGGRGLYWFRYIFIIYLNAPYTVDVCGSEPWCHCVCGTSELNQFFMKLFHFWVKSHILLTVIHSINTG